jgi:phosphoserine phosphatase
MLDHVVTLIGKNEGGLREDTVAEVRDALRRLGAETGRPDWLGEATACDLPFTDLHPDQADAAARSVLRGAPVDVIAQPVAGRRKQALIADMESTLIQNEMVDELAELVGCGKAVADITRQSMNGEIDFATSLRERVRLLRGLSLGALDEAARSIELMPGAATLVATMRHHGAVTAIVSGGFDVFTAKVRATLGMDHDVANTLLVADGFLTGDLVEPVLDRHGKFQALVRLAAEHGLALQATLAVGDGANDIEMIGAAGLGVAYRGKPVVAAAARHRLDHADLTGLLYAQGYRRQEFVL